MAAATSLAAVFHPGHSLQVVQLAVWRSMNDMEVFSSLKNMLQWSSNSGLGIRWKAAK